MPSGPGGCDFHPRFKQECIHCLGHRVMVLERWKAEAVEVLTAWERVHVALGSPGALGHSKAAASEREARRLVAANNGSSVGKS